MRLEMTVESVKIAFSILCEEFSLKIIEFRRKNPNLRT